MSGSYSNFRTIPNLQITDTTASTSSTTGSLVVAGGVGINGGINASLVSDENILLLSQNNNSRTLSFGNQGLICNSAGTFGKNTRSEFSILEVSTAYPSLTGVLIQGSASQTADLQQWRDSSNNVLAKVDNTGKLHTNTGIQIVNNNDVNVFSINTVNGFRTLTFSNSGFICKSQFHVQANPGDGYDLQYWLRNNGTIVAKMDEFGNFTTKSLRLFANNTAPTSSTDIGIQGEIRFDSNFIYYCVTTNDWKRAALSSW